MTAVRIVIDHTIVIFQKLYNACEVWSDINQSISSEAIQQLVLLVLAKLIWDPTVI
tara:strand:+ start:376 stop:543 length:168 start_codon:yes stop_codon:yes gene_type:complete